MDASWIRLLRCPASGGAYDLDACRRAGDEVVEAFLVSRTSRDVRPLLAGVAVLTPDLAAHLRVQGNVYRRTPITDPRMVRWILGQAGRGGGFVPFDEVVARYGDLAVEAPTPPAPQDEALATLLRAHAPPSGRGLDVGCGVGRGVFVLAQRLGQALGVDRSAARVRRARNVAVTQAAFFLPPPPGSRKEVAVDLRSLTRRGADFAVADPARLPLGDGCLDVAVLRREDGEGPMPGEARSETLRVLDPSGLLVLEGAEGPAGWARIGEAAPFSAWRREGGR